MRILNINDNFLLVDITRDTLALVINLFQHSFYPSAINTPSRVCNSESEVFVILVTKSWWL